MGGIRPTVEDIKDVPGCHYYRFFGTDYGWEFGRCPDQEKRAKGGAAKEEPPKGDVPKNTSPSPSPAPPVPPVEPDNGTTLIRVHVGSFEDRDMGGSVPSVAVFTEFGKRIGQVESKSEDTADGGFKDILIKHSLETENVRPSYLLLQGGKLSICISALSMEFPDETKMLFTGEDLALCDRLTLNPSRTFVGPSNDQPQCFWMRGTEDNRTTAEAGTLRMSLHLPDFIWSDARRTAYRENKDLVCRTTPRFHDFTFRGDLAQEYVPKLSDPIYIFNPPIEYDPLTHFDKYPERVLEWHQDKTSLGDYSDRPWESRLPWRPVVVANETTPNYNSTLALNSTLVRRANNAVFDLAELLNTTVPFTQGQAEEHRIRAQAPRLVISERDLSAVQQCRHGQWEGADFVSLSEQIYCDMQSRSMLFLCSEHTKQNCWDLKTKTLRSLTAPQRFASSAVAGPSIATTHDSRLENTLAVSWKASGALFGYTYQDITTIN